MQYLQLWKKTDIQTQNAEIFEAARCTMYNSFLHVYWALHSCTIWDYSCVSPLALLLSFLWSRMVQDCYNTSIYLCNFSECSGPLYVTLTCMPMSHALPCLTLGAPVIDWGLVPIQHIHVVYPPSFFCSQLFNRFLRGTIPSGIISNKKINNLWVFASSSACVYSGGRALWVYSTCV